jgi:hypothetical protein
MVEMTRDLQYALVHISKTILNCMSAPVVAQRTKAIRALGAAIAVDPVLLNRGDIRKSIQDRISDSSPAVRDAAIDLVGKYIPDKPDVALQYYPSISSRIAVSESIRVQEDLLWSYLYLHLPGYWTSCSKASREAFQGHLRPRSEEKRSDRNLLQACWLGRRRGGFCQGE